jgi:hypothetical protein
MEKALSFSSFEILANLFSVLGFSLVFVILNFSSKFLSLNNCSRFLCRALLTLGSGTYGNSTDTQLTNTWAKLIVLISEHTKYKLTK